MDSNKPILSASERKQTKIEKTFNDTLKVIEQLKVELANTELLAEKYLATYASKIHPTQVRYGQKLMDMAIVLDLRSHKFKLSKSDLSNLGDAIIGILRYASYHIDLSLEAQALWNQYSNESDVEENLSINESVDEPETHFEKEGQINDKKVDYQALKHEAKDKLDLKKMRAIYIRLAKLLHPDKQNQGLSQENNDAKMKDVTMAYENKDLLSLLNLEMKYIAKAGVVSDPSLIKSYISTLKKQVKSLKLQISELKSNPRYSLIKEYLNFTNEHQVENQINKEINENKKAIKAIDYNLKYIRSTQTKNDFLQIVEIADNDFNDY